MASLKEIKGRISSVRNTLKITSAMKLVASAKLRKAQSAIGNTLPYQSRLKNILVDLLDGNEGSGSVYTVGRDVNKVAIVCFSSNSSLCGGFNSNAIRKTNEAIAEYRAAGITDISVFPVGRKIMEAMKKAGFAPKKDYSGLSEHPTYAESASLGKELVEGFISGRFDEVVLIYNHFKSTASQPTVKETYLPLSIDDAKQGGEKSSVEYIVEPDSAAMRDILLPKVLLLKIYTVLLDTSAAEHAARTVAMQTATDNGNDLLQQLTLEYNKGRQQKITNELLDLEGGSLN